MKLTEAKLKQLINEVLEEAAVSPTELPAGISVMIELVSEDEISIDYVGEDAKPLKYNKQGEPYGVVIIDTKVQASDQLPCLNAMMVSFADASHGWGPMLYDVAMEIATLKGGGLVSDRTILRQDGYDVWEFYANNRSGDGGDVEAIQLDNENDSFDNGIQDDCLQTTTYDYSSKAGTDWVDSPISKIYRKKVSTLRALRDSEPSRLILKGINLDF